MTASPVIHMTPGVVTAGETAAQMQPSGGRAAKTPRQPFAQIATLVGARADRKADNTAAGKAPENPSVRGSLPHGPAPAIAIRAIVAKPPTTGTRKTIPRDPTGEVPVLAMLTHTGGEAAVAPTQVQPVKGSSPKAVTMNPAIPGGKEETPVRPFKGWRSPDERFAGDIGQAASGRIDVARRVAKGHGLTVQVLAEGQGNPAPVIAQGDGRPGFGRQTASPTDSEKPVVPKGAYAPGGRPASLVRPMTDTPDPSADVVPPETVTPGRMDGRGTAAPVPARRGAVEVTPSGGRVNSRPTAESNVLQAQTPAKNPELRTEQTRQVDPPAIQAQNGRPFIESRHVQASDPGDLGSESRQAVSAVHSPRQVRQAAEMNAPPAGAKAANPSQADGNAISQPPIVTESGRAAAALEYPSPGVPITTGAFEGAAARSPTASVGEQILDSVRASLTRPEQQLVVRLRPPELGSVLVRFAQDGGAIHGVLEVGRSDTRREIEQALPQMLRSLQELGIQVKRLDVTVADQPENDLGRGPSQQGAWTQQQDSHQHANQPQRSLDMGWTAGPDSADTADLREVVQPPADVPTDHIDMLA